MYEPKVNDVVVFADTYDATSQYRVTDVYNGRVTVDPVDPEGYRVGFDLSLSLFREMGATPVDTPEATPDVATMLADLRATWLTAMVDLTAKIDLGLFLAATFGDEVANAVFPIDDLRDEAASLMAIGDLLDALEYFHALATLIDSPESETEKV